MTEEKITELQSGFNTAFVNSAFNSNLAYRPQFIYNDSKNGQKGLLMGLNFISIP